MFTFKSFSNNGSRFLFSISCFMERFKEIFHIMTINDVNIATESFQTLTLKVTALHDYGRYKKNHISYSEYLKFRPCKCLITLSALSPNGLPCQFSISSMFGKYLPLKVLAMIAVGLILVFAASLNSYKLHDICIPIIVQSLLNLAFWSNSHNIKLCNINFVVKQKKIKNIFACLVTPMILVSN
uniref:Uncharacterized protein n=1 Tax=Glossina palpalis gambiensis TaxID=67801 RepID=A0A1B0B4B7_9MUSC